ncbi:hypothetical protein IF1G_00915 [Cordyceps javanica]|uniref:Uncharacterized protein n=1 Tax=Cordyceps javanica TaxID=43265 RepID=A0A545VGX5_9HYPO|nr:hypothetical protein IF1G_00915 [Cordyceps javanica]
MNQNNLRNEHFIPLFRLSNVTGSGLGCSALRCSGVREKPSSKGDAIAAQSFPTFCSTWSTTKIFSDDSDKMPASAPAGDARTPGRCTGRQPRQALAGGRQPRTPFGNSICCVEQDADLFNNWVKYHHITPQ